MGMRMRMRMRMGMRMSHLRTEEEVVVWSSSCVLPVSALLLAGL